MSSDDRYKVQWREWSRMSCWSLTAFSAFVDFAFASRYFSMASFWTFAALSKSFLAGDASRIAW